MNLLKIGLIRRLCLSGWFPLAAQLVTLVVFGLILAGGLGVKTSDPAFGKVLRNTNLANLLVWSYWWPLIIIASVLLGRIWCTVCPVELITALAGRIGLRRKVPDLLKSGWVITVFYAVVLLLGIRVLSIHRIPQRMAIYMLVLLGTAVIVSLVYQKRSFCSYVCPVGHLLGLYALIAPFEWRADDLSTCKSCKTKDCVTAKKHYLVVGRSCTSNLYPATINDNRQCLLCTQCLKVCPNDNLRFSIRRSFADFFQAIDLRAAQVAFILLVSGFVIYEVLSEWAVSKSILVWLPNHVVNSLALTGPAADLVIGIVMFIIFPAVLFISVVGAAKLLSRASPTAVLKAFALLLIPTMASGHLIKAILKMVSRIPYWPYVLSEPAGIETAQKIMDKTIVLDRSATDALYPVVTFVATALLIGALIATLLILAKSAAMRKLDTAAKVPLFLGAFVYWSIFALMIFKWRF